MGSLPLLGQDSLSSPSCTPFQLTAYAEIYYIYDFSNPTDQNRPFFYSHHRHNEVALNLGFIRAACQTDRFRGNLAFMAGTYANANLANEPGVLRSILEANIGIKLSAQRNVWLEAGIFNSHLGFENPIGAECWNMTRSLTAENAPYYLAGMKITYYLPNEKWHVGLLLLNGWQRMQRLTGTSVPALGHIISWKPSAKFSLVSGSFIGNDTPGQQIRYFHSGYAQLQLSKLWNWIVQIDTGLQQRGSSNGMHLWYAFTTVMRFQLPNKKWFIASRAEYYADPDEVIVSTEKTDGFRVFGYSVNLDRYFGNYLLWRLEVRTLQSHRDAIFAKGENHAIKGNWFIGSCMALSF